VLTAPRDLDESALAGALLSGWDIDVRSMTYRAVGWGSHHWDIRGADGARWFVTVDELENKRASADESLEQGLGRLRASLRSAVALREAGREFVVAPVPARDGEPAVRAGGRFAVADDVKSWELLSSLIRRAGELPAGPRRPAQPASPAAGSTRTRARRARRRAT
jgi:hypothetical protein